MFLQQFCKRHWQSTSELVGIRSQVGAESVRSMHTISCKITGRQLQGCSCLVVRFPFRRCRNFGLSKLSSVSLWFSLENWIFLPVGLSPLSGFVFLEKSVEISACRHFPQCLFRFLWFYFNFGPGLVRASVSFNEG